MPTGFMLFRVGTKEMGSNDDDNNNNNNNARLILKQTGAYLD